MSWLPNPFKSLRLSGDDHFLSDAAGVSGGGSVRGDLSEIGETIGRQLRGVAAFLAPPPVPPPQSPPTDEHSGDSRSPRLAGIRSDLAEISGSLKSSLSLVSSKTAAVGISNLASSFLRINEKEADDPGVGVTGEVVDFVTEISQCAECWTDFPLSLNSHDFSMTQPQAEHISIIEQRVPNLADLRIKLSIGMSESQFWMIYFVLLIPQLNESSLTLLLTPEVVETRNMLLAMLLNQRNSLTPNSNSSQASIKFNHKGCGETTFDEKMNLAENLVVSRGVQTSRVGTSGKFSEEEDVDTTTSIDAQGRLQNEGDISFSDLEDDDADLSIRRYDLERGQDAGSCSSDGSSEWVRLNKNTESRGCRSQKGQLFSQNSDSEGEESSDWLTIHKLDYFS